MFQRAYLFDGLSRAEARPSLRAPGLQLLISIALVSAVSACHGNSDDTRLREMQRKVAGNTGLHSAVVARASTFTTITLDQNNPSIETSRDSFIRLDLADGTCLLIRTERAAVLIDEVNGKTVEPLKSNNITYRFAQDIVENWPAQALRPDMECFPAASTDVLPATYCDHFKDDPAC